MPQNGPEQPRVCDRCIRQKVKCDLGKPQCSRCSERGLSCVYSSTRRKPGPVPGSRRSHTSRGTGEATMAEIQAQSLACRSALRSQSESRGSQSSITVSASTSAPIVDAFNFAAASCAEPSFEPLEITPDEQNILLVWYFENIHHAIPLFLIEKDNPVEEAVAATTSCSSDLVETIEAISAKLSRATLSTVTPEELQVQIDRLLGASSLREDIAGNSESLDHFRQSCLLAFYEYHQCPGQQAWMRVGKLVRSAYWTGLDRIEMMHKTSPKWMAMDERQLEEWRLVWWCIYCLDSYANVSTGMPYGIDERLINSYLPRGDATGRRRRMVLPYENDQLVEILRDLLAATSANDSALELRMISITMLRHIGRAIRFPAGISPDRFANYVRDTENRLYALRLALPVNFFNPRRNAFANESTTSQHFRLVTIHHILMAQMLIAIGHCRSLKEGEEWLRSWQQVLELCQDVAALAKQWNTSFCLSVDPALSIIAFVSLIFLDLQLKFASTRIEEAEGLILQTEIRHNQAVLMNFLERFAEFWTLPRLLILSFKSFKEALPSSLSYAHVQAALRRFESPLHPRWLTFLHSAESLLQGSPGSSRFEET